MEEKNILTAEGLKQYEDELEDLRVNKLREIAEKIKEARAQGDLSENAEYDAAKEEQGDIVARIDHLEKLLKNVEVVDSDKVDATMVNIGCKVKIVNTATKQDVVYSIVGPSEADILKGKLSADSPVGRALMGSKKNEVVTAETPAGEFKFKVIKIERA